MRAALLAAVSGIIFFLSQGVADTWALAWFAPAPLLWLAYGDAPRWQLLIASFAAFGLGQLYLAQCYWASLPPAIIVPLAVAMSVAFASPSYFPARCCAADLPRSAAGFPGALDSPRVPHRGHVAARQLRCARLSQMSFPAGVQVAALFGVHAIAFLLCLCASSVALLLRRHWTTGGAGVVVCALALVFGFVRLAGVEGPRVRVAALADTETPDARQRQGTRAYAEAVADTYAAYIARLSGVRVVAIPEGAVLMQEADQTAALAPLAKVARASAAIVVVGTVTPEPMQNRAFAFFPDRTIATYEKRHLLAPFETEVPGRDPGLLGSGYATQICKDMDFAGSVRTTAQHGVRLMIVPANDFGRDGWIHARMAIMRGVENGFAVLRSAFNGLETISDAQGRLLASAPTTRAGMVAVAEYVPLGPGPTLYTRIGDAFPWLCALLCLVLAVRLYFRTAVRREATADYIGSPADDQA